MELRVLCTLSRLCSLEPLRFHHQGPLLHPQPQHLNRPPWVLASLVSPGFSASWEAVLQPTSSRVSLSQEAKAVLMFISSPSPHGDSLCVHGLITPAGIVVLSPLPGCRLMCSPPAPWLSASTPGRCPHTHTHTHTHTQSPAGEQHLHSPFSFFFFFSWSRW